MEKSNIISHIPLADRMRPTDWADFFGQDEIVGAGKLLRALIDSDRLSSLIFWGPPGVGKTTLARIIAARTRSNFVVLSAVDSGKEDLRRVLKEAKDRWYGLEKQKTVLFIDEIHRWNKAQQDALLPGVEKGDIILIGATTENPSFEIVGPLLSRSRVFILHPLSEEDLIRIIQRALTDKKSGLGNLQIKITLEALQLLALLAGGDARAALNGLELASQAKLQTARGCVVLQPKDIKEALQKNHLVFDKKGEEFYNLISALHKSMRGSDANAALYWLARMVEGGADPLYIARRVLRFAAEDVGVADSRALLVANAAYDACHKLGYPECNVHLAEAVVYCALAKKSNILYVAYNQAAADAKDTSHLSVPLHLRNAPTVFLQDVGYGRDYKYNPDCTEPVEQDYLPPELKGKKYL